MKTMMNGLAGYARMNHTHNEAVRAVDMGITVVGTVLVALTYLLLHLR